ncbi:D-alanine--D-serine ligase VanG [Oscillospiraceae bacterium 50-58]
MEKLNVAVLFGGCSPEYGVSLESAYAVITHMDRTRYNPVLIGISSAGNWYHYTGETEKIKSDAWNTPADCTPALVVPDRDSHALLVLKNTGMEQISLDAAFPVLHGRNGEDGTVQGLLELAGIPLVGCGVLASALCMDKDRAHKLAQAAGVNVPGSIVLAQAMDMDNALASADKLGYPLFVKPLRAGSSYGITKVAGQDELPGAIKLAFEYDSNIILEEAISGFEVGCAVLGNDTLTVGELDEIELSNGFFNFTEKYTLKTSAIHVPARIPPAKAAEMKETAQRIYKALGCRGFARVDMFLDENGKVVFNEVNTIPGFTAHSRYPSMMKAVGMSFEQVISSVIELAVS